MAWPASVSGRERRWHFLCRVTFHGADYHFSTSAVSPSSSSGSIAHTPTLSVSGYSETFQYLSQSIDRQSVPVAVGWPYDIAEAVAAGFRLDTAQAELSVWIEGTAYEARRVLIVGNVQQPSYGAPGEPVTFSIEAAPWIDRGTWPDLYRFQPGQTPSSMPTSIGGAGGTTIALNPDDRSNGIGAPLVVGNPGNKDQVKRTPTISEDFEDNEDLWRDTLPGAVSSMTIGRTAGALPVPGMLVLCGHATEAGAYGSVDLDIRSDDVSLVNLYSSEGEWMTTTVPFHVEIGGRTCTVASLVDCFGTVAASGTQSAVRGITTGVGQARFGFTFLSSHRDFDTFHGLLNTAQAGPLRTVHELLALTLSSSSLPVDWPKLYAALGRLPSFGVEGYVDERVSVWDFVSRELLPLLPMSLRTGPRGLYALTADFTATVSDTIGTLRAGLDCWRVGVIQYERRLSDLTGTLEIECGSNLGQPSRTVTADGTTMLQGQRARLAQESSVVGQLLSRVQSADVAAGQTTTTIKAPWLAGETGGQYVAHQRLAYQAAQIRTVRYRLAPEFLELEVGDLVRLVDPEVHIDGPAYLSTLEIDASAIVGTFSLFEPVSR
jgi:hypothetical protein